MHPSGLTLERTFLGITMKKLIAALALVIAPVAAYAACTTHTYFIDGKTVMCTTCCYGGNCTTNCF